MSLEETQLEMVAQFLQKFGVNYAGPPRDLPASIAHFRTTIMQEELDELRTAIQRGELEQQLDALVDMAYVLFGTVIVCGYKDIFDEAFRRVHAANMRKIKVATREGSKRDSKHDIVKPDDWVSPDLSDLVEKEHDSARSAQLELPL